MISQTLAPLNEALAGVARGWYIHPLVPKTKRPITDNGKDDASNDPQTINQWWALWPDAGPAVNLELSGLVLISPDSEAWLKTFRDRGLPTTMTYRSRVDERWHLGFLYRRPENCPITKINREGEYDIIANGSAVLPPSIHPDTGDVRTWVYPPEDFDQLPECPKWAVDMLVGRQKEKPALRSLTNDDEPPVYLSGHALDRWHGERFKLRDDGNPNRSDILFAIACDLIKGGMTNPGVAAALADRDQAFPFPDGPKYANRPEYYLITAANARAAVNAEPAPARWESGTDSPCNERVAELEAENERLRAENTRLRERISKFFQVIRNPNIKGEKLTALATVFEAASAESREADRDGWVRVSRSTIAAKAGTSEATVSTHMARLDDWGVIDKRVVRVPLPVDPETGEILPKDEKTGKPVYISELQVRLRGTPETTLDRLATLEPFNPKKWGGKRVACPDHPDAILRKTTVLSCTECGQVVDSLETYQSPEGLPIKTEDLPERLKSKLAISGETATTGEKRNNGSSPLISDDDGPLFAPSESRNRILPFQTAEHDECQMPGCHSRLYSAGSRRLGYCETHRREAYGCAAAGGAG